MTFRMSVKHVQAKVDIVNGMLGFDTDNISYNTVGAVRLHQGHQFYAVYRICNEAGGISDLSYGGTLRETANFLSGMIAALRIAKDEQVTR